MRLHVKDIEDHAFVVDVGDGERHEGVFHPETQRLALGKHEDHAGVRFERKAVHQANHSGVVVRRDFRFELHVLDRKLNHRQIFVDLRQGRRRQESGEQRRNSERTEARDKAAVEAEHDDS